MTASTDSQVRAGWYPDPLGSPQLRWWDGRSWTSHTSTARTTPARTEARPVDFADPDASGASAERSAPRHRTEQASDGAAAATGTPFAEQQSALPAGTADIPELG